MRGVVSACSLQESNHRGFLPRKGPGTLLYYFHGGLGKVRLLLGGGGVGRSFGGEGHQ